MQLITKKTNEMVLGKEARNFILNAQSENTKRAYTSDLKSFQSFCDAHNLPFFPTNEETLIGFASSQAKEGIKKNSILRKLSAIKKMHSLKKFDLKEGKLFKEVLKGIGKAQKTGSKKAHALTVEIIKEITSRIGTSGKDLRDKVIILLGFAGALRRSELTNLKINDLSFTKEGLFLNIREAKTAKNNEPQKVFIPFGKLDIIPMVKAYISENKLEEESFLIRGFDKWGNRNKSNLPMDAKEISKILKKWGKVIGLNPEEISGHSLRRGFISSAVSKGVAIPSIQKHSRHRSISVLLSYAEERELTKNHAGESFL